MTVDEQFQIVQRYGRACSHGNPQERVDAARQVLLMLHALNRRFEAVIHVIDAVEDRCLMGEGPRAPTHDEEITFDELRTIYVLAGGSVE